MKTKNPFRETDYELSESGRIKSLQIDLSTVVKPLPEDAPWYLRQKAMKESRDRKQAFMERMRKDLQAPKDTDTDMAPGGM